MDDNSKKNTKLLAIVIIIFIIICVCVVTVFRFKKADTNDETNNNINKSNNDNKVIGSILEDTNSFTNNLLICISNNTYYSINDESSCNGSILKIKTKSNEANLYNIIDNKLVVYNDDNFLKIYNTEKKEYYNTKVSSNNISFKKLIYNNDLLIGFILSNMETQKEFFNSIINPNVIYYGKAFSTNSNNITIYDEDNKSLFLASVKENKKNITINNIKEYSPFVSFNDNFIYVNYKDESGEQKNILYDSNYNEILNNVRSFFVNNDTIRVLKDNQIFYYDKNGKVLNNINQEIIDKNGYYTFKHIDNKIVIINEKNESMNTDIELNDIKDYFGSRIIGDTIEISILDTSVTNKDLIDYYSKTISKEELKKYQNIDSNFGYRYVFNIKSKKIENKIPITINK